MSYAQWRDRFAEAVDGRFYTIDYLDWVIGTGRARLWPGTAAAIVTQLRRLPACTVLHGLIAAGDLDEIILELIPAAEAWGRAQGCRFATIESRQGWSRILGRHGYRPHQLTLTKEL